MKPWLAPGMLVSTLAFGAIVACSAAGTPPDVANYGPPNGISGKHPASPPSSSGSGGSSGSSSGTSGGSSGSSSGTSGGSSGGTTTFPCGTPVASGTCAISWKNDIYPKMKSGGAWGCGNTGSCHGTQGGVKPFVDPTDEKATYASLMVAMAGVQATSLPYINPCSTDPAQSLFVCNTSPNNTCSVLMPLTSPPLGQNATTTQDQADILTWVKCGAPEN